MHRVRLRGLHWRSGGPVQLRFRRCVDFWWLRRWLRPARRGGFSAPVSARQRSVPRRWRGSHPSATGRRRWRRDADRVSADLRALRPALSRQCRSGPDDGKAQVARIQIRRDLGRRLAGLHRHRLQPSTSGPAPIDRAAFRGLRQALHPVLFRSLFWRAHVPEWPGKDPCRRSSRSAQAFSLRFRFP